MLARGWSRKDRSYLDHLSKEYIWSEEKKDLLLINSKDWPLHLGFVVVDKQEYAGGHYVPDLVWKRGKTKIGFEVEYGKVSNKKIVGDAFWLCRTFDMGVHSG